MLVYVSSTDTIVYITVLSLVQLVVVSVVTMATLCNAFVVLVCVCVYYMHICTHLVHLQCAGQV